MASVAALKRLFAPTSLRAQIFRTPNPEYIVGEFRGVKQLQVPELTFIREFLRKEPRLKLDQGPYRILRLQVLDRDGWRCQQCGSMKNLEVHHLNARSQLGHDCLENLITLCHACHSETHGR
jgi:hypothetical protein